MCRWFLYINIIITVICVAVSYRYISVKSEIFKYMKLKLDFHLMWPKKTGNSSQHLLITFHRFILTCQCLICQSEISYKICFTVLSIILIMTITIYCLDNNNYQ